MVFEKPLTILLNENPGVKKSTFYRRFFFPRNESDIYLSELELHYLKHQCLSKGWLILGPPFRGELLSLSRIELFIGESDVRLLE